MGEKGLAAEVTEASGIRSSQGPGQQEVLLCPAEAESVPSNTTVSQCRFAFCLALYSVGRAAIREYAEGTSSRPERRQV